MKTCKICGRSFDDENCEGVVVNEGTDNEYFVCEDCVPDECNNGHIISCENCGSYFTPDRLHDEHIGGLYFYRMSGLWERCSGMRITRRV